jgi:hypothetical protein
MNTPNNQQNLFSNRQPQPVPVAGWTDAQPNSLSRAFILGGNAKFTVKSGKTGEHRTFRVSVNRRDRSKPIEMRVYYASVLTGPDNESSYTYMGIINKLSGDVVLTYASKFNRDHLSMKILMWVTDHIWNNKPIPPGTEIKHSGTCGCCGRTLTTPESIDRGIGPECWKRSQR